MKPDAPPEANALYFGEFPPGAAYAKPKDVQQPVVLDWDIGHPMMQYIRDMKLVFILGARIVELPVGAKSLIDSDQGPLAFLVPREGFTDAVVTFPLMESKTPNTTWFRYISFPLFILNSIQALGNVREGAGEDVAEPGNPVPLHAETINREITVASADRPEERIPLAPGDFYLQPRREGRPVFRAGTRRAGSPSPSTCSTSARATWPRADWSPRELPPTRPSRTRSRLAITPSLAPRNPPRSRRTSGGTSPCWFSACCWSSGMFIIGEFIFESRHPSRKSDARVKTKVIVYLVAGILLLPCPGESQEPNVKVPGQATVSGNYSNLLRTIKVPADEKLVGKFCDLGYYPETEYAEY